MTLVRSLVGHHSMSWESIITEVQDINKSYRVFRIPKPNGKVRVIEEPNLELKQRQIELINVFGAFPFYEGVYGIKEKNTIDNALRHKGARALLKMDIKKFFPSTTIDKFNYAMIRSDLPQGEKFTMISDARYCFVKDKAGLRLPTGAPTSPIIANISFSVVDNILSALALERDLVYTRYVDDLAFSGYEIPKGFQVLIRKIVEDAGYSINHKKSELLYQGNHSQIVTGISINGHQTDLVLDKKYKRKLRAELDRYARENLPIDDTLHGKLNYVRQINRQQYETLIAYFNRRRQRWGNNGHF